MRGVRTVTAFDERGNDYTIHVREDERSIELRTSDGQEMIRISQGIYDVIRDTQTIRVMSGDFYAP
jgi:hypothetical protein